MRKYKQNNNTNIFSTIYTTLSSFAYRHTFK
jgi:hypothetical protein